MNDTIILSNIESLAYCLPEFIVILFAIIVVGLDIFKAKTPLVFWSTVAGLVIAGGVLLSGKDAESARLFYGMMAFDAFGHFFRVLAIAAALLTMLISYRYQDLERTGFGEYSAMVLFTTVGMMFLATATDMVMIYLALEMVSMPSYILAAFSKHNAKASEAGLKYVVFGAASSGAMLFGLSWLYGLTGQTDIFQIGNRLMADSVPSLPLMIAGILTTAGFGYKIAMVPFHVWLPDVYEGSSTPITAFFSIGPKAAGFAVFIRFFYVVFATPNNDAFWMNLPAFDWMSLFAIISAATMTVGNLAAVPQQNVKRLLAYSSIGHAGYMLMGMVLLTTEGIQAILFYLVIYYLMNIGAFLVVIVVYNITQSESIEDYRGLGWRMPLVSATMTVFLLSLTGLPPFGGFIGKVYLFAAAIHQELYWLVFVAILNSVISLFYYVRIIRAMYLDKGDDDSTIAVPTFHTVMLGVLAAFVILLGIYWTPLANWTKLSLQFITG
ncbi:MAG: NADH-quinone oxidoreductase subunit N [Gemmatimonadetes bacterium]|nr:MAG: NADH-quinone oxidoreductase subunit N [Gemmatimonadota bacterium]